MTKIIRSFRAAWLGFKGWVEEPIDPRPLGLFRLWFGFLTLVNLFLLWPDMEMWFGNHGVIPPELHQQLTSIFRIQIFALTGYNDKAILVMKILGLAGGLGLVLGLFPRTAAFCMWLVASSYAWRNSAILHSGDSLVRIGSFFLIFARSDAAFSLRSYLRAHRDKNVLVSVSNVIPAWPQRILQVQLCIVYLSAALWKLKGEAWRQGTAVGTVLQLGEFERFPIPDFMLTSTGSMIGTYFTLGFELLFPFMVWIPLCRVPFLVMGILLHAGLEWSLNIQMFQWVITSFYILFIRVDDKSIKTVA